MENNIVHDHDGPALAAVVSSGIGCAVLGAMTVAAQVSPVAKAALNWWNPAGPLTGKTGVAVIAWLASWCVLHLCWRDRNMTSLRPLWLLTLALIGLGWLGTFPPFFESLGHF